MRKNSKTKSFRVSQSGFYDRVYRVTKKIPRGRVSTYRLVALAVGSPQAARAVGQALNKNPYAPQVPCHRVVRSNGEVGGFASGPQKKMKMLRREGVLITRRKIDLKKFGWRLT